MTRVSGTLGWSGLAGLVLLVSFARGDNSVYILSKYGQRVTSSTLNWLPIGHYEDSKDIVIGGFEVQRMMDHERRENQASNPVVTERSIYVCRVFHNGVPVAGKQIEGEKRCTVTHLGNVASYERYDLLENVDNSARLSWLTWDKFHTTPVGAVAAETKYVARHVVSEEESVGMDKNHGYTHYIGTYDSDEGLGRITYVKDDGEEGTAESGEILVETEPTFYELTAVKLNYHRKRIIKRVPRVLREATISNEGSESAVLAEAFGYTFNYSVYWGQGHAMIKALNTSITNVNGTRFGFISWGIEDESVRSNVYTVEVRLEPGTAVNVTLRANYTDMEVPYSGELVSIYEDGERKSRMMNGVCREETMMDLEPEFGPVYYPSNMSLAPTTVAPPSVEAATVATITSGPKYTSSEDTDAVEEATPEIDENLIVPRRNNDPSNIQNDDGGPLSLKNKVEGAKSVATSSLAFEPNVVFVATSVIAFYRIT